MHRFPMLRAAAALVIFGGLVAIWQQPWAEPDGAHGEMAMLDQLGYGDGGETGSEARRAGRSGEEAESAAPAPSEGLGQDSAGVTAGDKAIPERVVLEPAAELEMPFDSSAWNADVGLGGAAGGVTVDSLSVQVDPNTPRVDIGFIAQPPASPTGPPSAAAPSTPAPGLGTPLTSSLGYTGVGGGGGGAMAERRALDGARRDSLRLRAGGPVEESAGEEQFFGRFREVDERSRQEALYDLYAYDYDLEQEDADDFGLVRHATIDGYGVAYYDEQLIEHLRPHCRECREIADHRGRCQHHEAPRDMFFRFYGDNAVVRTAEDNFSTFAADVDTASYPLTRNYLVSGALPPKTAIRTEEFVNYFKLGLQPPAEGDFAVHLDALPSLFSDGQRLLLRAGVQARTVSREERKPLNLVFVIDKSGSMAQQNRIELVKRSLELLVDQLRDDDTVGIVTFDSNGHEVLQPTKGHLRWEIREAIRSLGTGGSTNAAAGLDLGFAMAEKAFRADAVNRVVLASDGVANTGETDQQRILDDVRAKAEAHIDLTTIGVGMGNHNDVFLEQLADKGDGSCHYVDDFDEAKRVLVDGFTGVMQVVARDVKIQLEFDGEVVDGWRQLGYENRSLTKEQFRDDSVDAGEVGAGHSVAALYELDLAQGAGGDAKLVTLRLRWFPDGADEAVEEEHVLKLSAARSKWALAEPRLRLSAVAAQYAEVLRRSYHARSDSYEVLKSEADALARELHDDASVVELRDMIRRTESLGSQFRWSDDDPLVAAIDEARRTRILEAQLARMEETEKNRKLLEDIRKQNDRIEAQIRDLVKQQ